MESPSGIVFKRSKLRIDPRTIVPHSASTRYSVVSIPELPLYMQYIHQGTPEMYERDSETNELVLKGRPWPYTVLKASQGQAPWVSRSGFALPDDDRIESDDFFDVQRRVSLNIVHEPEDSELSVVFEQLYMTAYMLFDMMTNKLVCGDKRLLSTLFQAPHQPPPKTFFFL